MSLQTRKNGSGAAGALGRGRQQSSEAAPPAKTAGVVLKQRADEAAAIAVPLAKNAGVVIKQRADGAAAIAVPLAKNAGVVLKQRADDAAAWAAPYVNDARALAAPRVEQAGVAVEAKIAPQVSDILTKAARQLDPVPKAPEKRSHARLARGSRCWPRSPVPWPRPPWCVSGSGPRAAAQNRTRPPRRTSPARPTSPMRQLTPTPVRPR